MHPRLLLATLICALLALGQQSVKRPLTHRDADAWRSITNQSLSRDGKLLAYAVFPEEGDGQLVLKNLATGEEKHESIGALPPPPDPSAVENPEEQPVRTPGVRILFTLDQRFVLSTTFPSKADVDRAKKERKRPDQMPKGGLVILATDPASQSVTRIPSVKSMQVPETGDGFVVYLKEAPAPANPPPTPEAPQNRIQHPPTGADLIVRDLRTAEALERTFPDATEYALSKDGKMLVYAVTSKSEDTNGVYAVRPLETENARALVKGKGKYAKPTFDRLQQQVAFLAAPEDPAAKFARFRLYLWDRKSAAPAELISSTTPGLREGFAIYDRAVLNFSHDGSRVFLGLAPTPATPAPPPPASPPAAAIADEKVIADLWHWKDDYVQPMQKVRATQDRNRSYRGVFHIAEKRFVQLADPTMAAVTPSDDGRYAIGVDDRPFRSMVDYDGNYANYYLVNTLSGERKLLFEKYRGSGFGPGPGFTWSPDGKHVLFFKNNDWHTVSIPEGVDANLTGRLGVKFINEEHDSPSSAPAYGTAGWTKDGKVLVYDRYDIWLIGADAKSARNVTAGQGRREKLQFRVIRLDRAEAQNEDDRGIDPAKPLLLHAESLETRDTGLFEERLDRETAPRRLIMGSRNYRPLLKARDADVVLLTAASFADEPDLNVTDSSFRELRKVTDINPQKAQIRWGTGELISFRSTDGIPLQASLYKPENFDPAKKYPMIVYIYERLSQNLHAYVPPRPGTSINISYYVSNGYLVLTPDIAYTIGAPGPSALKCVLPAVEAVAARGFVDENAIGIQGHSWGGYQIAYMITQTSRFRAAEAGAPVADMISAYNGIRWGTGLPRQFQYEQTQSRIGGTPWQYPLRFIENSPVYHMDRVQTPLLILQNDGDDAVPWYQGLELFLSLRRLGKEAYLFNYNGEAHGLRKRWNQKDFTIRMQQYFDHFLKGAPAPEWMVKGIPYVDRETEKEKFQAATDQRP